MCIIPQASLSVGNLRMKLFLKNIKRTCLVGNDPILFTKLMFMLLNLLALSQIDLVDMGMDNSTHLPNDAS